MRGKVNDQLSKLQAKHNAEVELLEDLKLFTRQRSALEKQYAEVRGGGMGFWNGNGHDGTMCDISNGMFFSGGMEWK